MNRATMVITGGAAALLFGFWLYPRLVSDETKIRWRVQGAIDAFNDTDVGDCVDLLHADFSDTTTTQSLTRVNLHRILLYVFAKERDPKTRRFLYRAELPEEQLVVRDIDSEAGTARVEFVVVLWRGLGDAEEMVWEARVHGELVRSSQLGWLLQSSAHETVSGRRPDR